MLTTNDQPNLAEAVQGLRLVAKSDPQKYTALCKAISDAAAVAPGDLANYPAAMSAADRKTAVALRMSPSDLHVMALRADERERDDAAVAALSRDERAVLAGMFGTDTAGAAQFLRQRAAGGTP
jgi:hypothetical protein